MTPARILVVYSPEDSKHNQQLQNFIRPLERDGLIDCWSEDRLKAGDDRQEAMEKALEGARVAVVLVSQHLLASDRIYSHQLPRLLARAQGGELTLLSVFLSPATAELEISYTTPDGTPHRDSLTRFQGCGSPQKPLSDLLWSDRQRQYTKLADRLRELAADPATGVSAPMPAPTVNPHPPVTAAPTAPSRDYTLSVSLDRTGDRLRVCCHLPGTDPIAERSCPWERVKALAEPVAAARDEPGQWQKLLDTAREQHGPALFELLFGREQDWEPVLRTLFHRPLPQPRPNPVFAPVRLRICSDEPLLRDLPWRLTAWNRRLLVEEGWTFLLGDEVDPVLDCTSTAPFQILMLAPREALNGERPDPAHPRAVEEVVRAVWPNRQGGLPYLRVVHDRRALDHALAGMGCHLLYVYGFATRVQGRPCLLLDGPQGPEPLSPGELAEALNAAHTPPQVVYFNLAGPGAGLELPAVPLVLSRQLPRWTPEATGLALAWLRRWLESGRDPVDALHQVSNKRLDVEAATLKLCGRYRHWKLHRTKTGIRQQLAHLALDRDTAKALVTKHLLDLVHSGPLRAMALISYAAPGNRLESLYEQLRHYLDVAAFDQLAIRRRRLEFPPVRENLRHTLEDELRQQLECEDNEDVTWLLRRHGPRVTGGGSRAVLWLDWGVCNQADDSVALKPSHLEAWLRFTSEFLADRCPDDLRIVSYLAIEQPDTRRHAGFVAKLQDYHNEPWCLRPGFWLSLLPPLEAVPFGELLKYLRDHTCCEVPIQPEVARRLILRTGGQFEQTAALAQEAEESRSWYDLLIRLRREQGAGRPSEEDEEAL